MGSSWLGQGGGDDRGRLVVAKEQLYELTGGVAATALDDADLRLALLHHPLEWLHEWDAEEMKRLLADRVDLVLRGHLHHTGLTLTASPGRVFREVAAGASYAGEPGWRNAYSVGRVTFGTIRHVKLWLRAYVPAERAFTKDVATYVAAEDGTWEIRLDERPRASTPVTAAHTVGAASTPPYPRPYLERLLEEHRYLDVRGLGAKAVERMELRQVYTRLRVVAADDERWAPRARTKRGPRRGEAFDDLAEPYII